MRYCLNVATAFDYSNSQKKPPEGGFCQYDTRSDAGKFPLTIRPVIFVRNDTQSTIQSFQACFEHSYIWLVCIDAIEHFLHLVRSATDYQFAPCCMCIRGDSFNSHRCRYINNGDPAKIKYKHLRTLSDPLSDMVAQISSSTKA